MSEGFLEALSIALRLKQGRRRDAETKSVVSKSYQALCSQA